MLVPEGAKAGKISKPYGLQGELNIILEPLAGNNIEPDSPLFIDIDGQRVPFFVEEVELVSAEQAIIKFEFIDTLEAAGELRGCSIYFDSLKQMDQLNKGEEAADLIGYMAFDPELGQLGYIADFLPHPMNPLFVIQSEKRELMIPAARELIDHIDSGKKIVRLKLPEGITKL